MSGLLAIVRKDLRRLRWWLLVWIALNGYLVLAILVPHLVAPGRWLMGVVDNLLYGGALPISTVAMMFALVRDDLPFDGNAFWVARPISGGLLAAAKIVEVVAVLWLVPLLFGVVLWSTLRFTAADMLGAAWLTLRLQAGISLAVLPFALLGERRRPELSWLCLFLAVIGAVLVAARLTGLVNGCFNHLRLGLSESRTEMAALLTWATLAFAAAVAYGTRRFARTLAVIGGGAACIALVVFAWPWDFNRSAMLGAAQPAEGTPRLAECSLSDLHLHEDPSWGRLRGSIAFARSETPDAWGGGGLVDGVWSCGGRSVRVEGKFAVVNRANLAEDLVNGKASAPYKAAFGLDVFVVDARGTQLPLPGLGGVEAGSGIRLTGTLLFHALVADPVVREPLGGGAWDQVRPWRIRIEEGKPWFGTAGARTLVIRAIAPAWNRPRTEFFLVNKSDGRVAGVQYLRSDILVYGVMLKHCGFSLPPETEAHREQRSGPRPALPYELALVNLRTSPLLTLPISTKVAFFKP